MVESGSTTTYQGNGIPFPNWLVYDSSLFEVKVNGKPATFNAPSPSHPNDTLGYVEYPYANAWLPQDDNIFEGWRNLLVNIDSDGLIGERTPWYTKSFIVDGQQPVLDGEEPSWEPDYTKGLYLYGADYASMTGKPNIPTESSVNLYDLPYIKCDELNLTILYDMDAKEWRLYHGDAQINIVLEWRFKELCSLENSPPFLDIDDIRWNSVNIYQEFLLNPLLTVIPNSVDTTLVEVHARSIVTLNNPAPRYMGRAMCTWPNLHSTLLSNPNRASDESIVMLPISNIAQKGDVVIRLNNEHARIVQNTISETYSIGVFNNDNGYEQNRYSGAYVPVETTEEGIIRIASKDVLLQYTAKNGQWSIVNSNVPDITVELMFLTEANIEVHMHQNHYPNMVNRYNDMYNYFGFVLSNPVLKTEVAVNAETNVNMYLNHERISSNTNMINMVPNFEAHGVENYNCYINGELVAPSISYGVNDVITSVRYPINNLPDGELEINVSNYWADLYVNSEMLDQQATAPNTYSYLLDGNRDTNLDINPLTGIFNRYIPLNIYWEFMGEVPISSRIPIFIKYKYGQATERDYDDNAISGIYLNHYYNGANKTATLSISPNITTMRNHLHPSLAMVHERDIVRGWKTSGYTGKSIRIADIQIRKDSIGFPIVIKEEAVEPTTIAKLPITLEALGFSGSGRFDVLVNGVLLGEYIPAEEIGTVLANDPRFNVVDTGEAAPNELTLPSHTGDIELIGEFDVFINGKLIVNDITPDELIELVEVGNLDETILFVATKQLPPPPPPPPEAT